MKHIRSKLVVKVKRGDYTGDGVITTGTVSGSSMMLNGSFDVKTEKFQSTEGSGALSFTGTVSEEGTLEDQWFVFSKFGGSASKLSFNLTIDGIKYPTALLTEGVIFEKGKKYIYTLVFGKANGGYDEDGEDILVPISFTVSVDDFTTVVEKDVNFNK